VVSTLRANSGNAAYVIPPGGLTCDEARRRHEKFGPNTLPDTTVHPFRRALEKFWAPVPWMLEAAIVLELLLGKYVEAAIIAFLLVSTRHSASSRKVAHRPLSPR
jgi:H+-transporting ATPase